MEENRPDTYLPIFQDKHGSYILSSKDLCLLEYIPDLIDAGVDALKIEGRMKGINYVGNVVKSYRQAIDEYLSKPEKYAFRKEWFEELRKVSHRGYTTGFFCEGLTEGIQNYSSSSYVQTHELVGVIREILRQNTIKIEVRNQIRLGDELEFVRKSGEVHRLFLEKIMNEDCEEISIAQPNQSIILAVDFPADRNDLIRRER